MTHVNLTAYEGVESLGRFSPAEFRKYCNDKLKSCDKHIEFLRQHFPGRPLRILEIGSGSGKLLFRLEREGMIEYGLGLEVSRSRCRFAAEFAKYCESKKVSVRNEDFIEADLHGEVFDVVIGIDVVTNLIGAISKVHTQEMLTKAHSCLVCGGGVVLELMTCEREINFIRQSEGGVYRTWKRFDESDPFRFGLDEITRDTQGNVVWNKEFVAREGAISSFRNVLKPFPETIIEQESQAVGLKCEFFKSWTKNDDTADQEYVVVLSPTKGVSIEVVKEIIK
jgi:SAM-dependent methyltransferase